MQETFGEQRFFVLAFPCNQFGKQEPGTNEEILAFARDKYDANFPMFAKIEVNGEGACDLYKMLKAAQPNEDGSAPIPWNFTKFLVDRSGSCVKRFSPQDTPSAIQSHIDGLL